MLFEQLTLFKLVTVKIAHIKTVKQHANNIVTLSDSYENQHINLSSHATFFFCDFHEEMEK